MARGRPRTPTKIKLLKGTAQPCRINKDAPQASGELEKPEWLDPYASEKWDKLVKYLTDLGIVGSVDADALASYCYLQSKFVELAKVGDIPSAALMTELRNLQSLFGMNPSSREKLTVKKPEKASNPWLDIAK